MAPAADRPRLRCAWEDCQNLEELSRGRTTGGLCSAHRKQKRRRGPLGEVQTRFRPSHSARDRLIAARRNLLEAALAYAEAEPEALDRAEARVFYASRQVEAARATFRELLERRRAHAHAHRLK